MTASLSPESPANVSSQLSREDQPICEVCHVAISSSVPRVSIGCHFCNLGVAPAQYIKRPKATFNDATITAISGEMRAGFSDNPEQWDVCRLTPCMLFVEMATIATASASSEVSSRPFLCRRRIESASWLSGIGLEIIDLLSTEKHQPLYDSFCLFGGPKCSFNDMVAFVGAAKEHQFIAGGFVFLMPKRISADTRASAPLTEDALIVVGKANEKSDVKRAYEAILRPFELWTWIVFISYLFLAFCFHVFLAWYFANPRSPINVCRHILLDFTRSKKKNSEPIRMLNQVAVGIMLFAVTVSSVIGILSYEIAVVNFLFNSDDMFLEKELGSLSLKDLQQYVVVEKDGIETIFRALVGGEKSKLIKKSQLCSNPKECYDKLENDSDPAKFFFTFDNGFRYVQHETKACNLTVFKTRSPLSSVPAGWYYGSRVPKTRQIAVDKAILEHRMQHKIQTVINNGLPSANCSAKTNKIKPPFIGWLLLTVIAVCMVPILSTLIATGVLRNKTRASRGERQ